MTRIIALVFGIYFMIGAVEAQTLEDKFGIDSAQTIMNASIYSEFVKQKSYKDALPAWRYVFVNAPKFQITTYSRGVAIMAHMLKDTKNPAYLDTMMMVYDQQIKYYGTHPRFGEGFILGRQGSDLARFGKDDPTIKKRAYGFLAKSFELGGKGADPRTVSLMFFLAGDLLDAEILTRDEYINVYMKVSDFTDHAIKGGKHVDEFKEMKTEIDAMFFNSGVADCQTLDKLLTAKLNASPDDLENLKSISSLLRRNECVDLPLFSSVAEKLYQLEPTADAAYSLAVMFLRDKDYDKAGEYLKEAIEKSDNNEDKSGYYIRLAQMEMGKKQFSGVKKNALESLKLNPKNGAALILIGQAYAFYAPSYGKDAFDHASVYLAAVDKFNRAKQVDPSVAAEANKWIKDSSQRFPSKDEAFFRSITEGASIKLGSWINETTTARFAK